MKNMKFWRTALVATLVLTVMLSVTGGTIAWFTDEVTSASNVIQAGNLDVEMYWANGKEDPATASWVDASTGKIFNYDKWEPGYVEVRHVKIENKGTLAFKYQLGLVENGQASNLADAIDVYYTDPAAKVADRTELVEANKIGTLTEVLAGMSESAAGELLPGASHVVTLALKMRESAGNEYQGLAMGSDFSMKLLATQLTAESDSFGSDYDAGATLPEEITEGLHYDGVNTYYVTSAAGLKAVADAVNGIAQYTPNLFQDKTVKLMCNIDLGGVEWNPIGTYAFQSNEFEGIFDGQGHTISNFKVTTLSNDPKARSSYGFFGNVKGTVKNLTVKNATVDVNGGKFAAALVGRLNGGLIDNCHVVDSDVTIYNWQVGGLVGQVNAGDIKNCSVKGSTITGYAAVGAIAGIRLNAGENTIENCSVSDCKIVNNGSFGGSYDQMFGAILGAAYNGDATVRINNCSVEDTTIKGEESSVLCGYVENGDIVLYDVTGDLIEYDGTIGLSATLAAMKSGDALLMPTGTYNTSGTFVVPAGVTIMGAEGANVVIHQNSAAQDNIFNCEGDVVIRNITFESNRKGYAVTDNTKNHDTDGDITIINCRFTGLASEKNWGVYKNLNGNLTIENCTFDNYDNAICGVNNGNGSATVITGCTFTNINGEAIGYVTSTLPADFESEVIANNTGLTAYNVIGY